MIDSLIFRKNRRAKHLRLSINKAGQPVLTVPWFCPKSFALKWAESHQQWIQKHTFIPTKFTPNQTILLCGTPVLLTHRPELRGTTLTDSTLMVGGHIEYFHRRVQDFITSYLHQFLIPKVEQATQKLDVTYHHITIRNTHTRWGSCSSTHNLSFNRRLALCPEFVIDYLVAHEVSHLKHMNHSPSFWQTVQSLMPDYSHAKNWLKHHPHIG